MRRHLFRSFRCFDTFGLHPELAAANRSRSISSRIVWNNSRGTATSTRGYYENKTKGDFVVQLKGPYDIALNKQPDGTFGLTADLWNGHVEKEIGQGYGKLLQLYGVHKATIEARKKGLSVLRRQQQNGSIKLVLMGV